MKNLALRSLLYRNNEKTDDKTNKILRYLPIVLNVSRYIIVFKYINMHRYAHLKYLFKYLPE